VTAPPPDFEIRLADEGGVSVVTVSGELAPRDWRLSIVPDLQDSVRQILDVTGMMDVLPFENTEPGEQPWAH
jgi:hypothetical protein